jgi:hypothetical protein
VQHQQYIQEDFKFISKLSTLKTSNLIDFSKAASIRLKMNQKISDYYNKDNWSKAFIEDNYFILTIYMFRLIKYNSNGYIGEKKHHCDSKQKSASLPPKDNMPAIPDKKRAIAYGDGSFFKSMKGRLPAPNR